MGQCIYVASDLGHRHYRMKGPATLEMRSEAWMDPAEAGRILAKDHFLNTTIGVWFYEGDLHDKAELRKTLDTLVKHVTSPEYLEHYEQFGRGVRAAYVRKNILTAALRYWRAVGVKARFRILSPRPLFDFWSAIDRLHRLQKGRLSTGQDKNIRPEEAAVIKTAIAYWQGLNAKNAISLDPLRTEMLRRCQKLADAKLGPSATDLKEDAKDPNNRYAIKRTKKFQLAYPKPARKRGNRG